MVPDLKYQEYHCQEEKHIQGMIKSEARINDSLVEKGKIWHDKTGYECKNDYQK